MTYKVIKAPKLSKEALRGIQRLIDWEDRSEQHVLGTKKRRKKKRPRT